LKSLGRGGPAIPNWSADKFGISNIALCFQQMGHWLTKKATERWQFSAVMSPSKLEAPAITRN
jgi:hypothetical protein